jgi:16S rRNA (uracil1498-N3)-methyltransferase
MATISDLIALPETRLVALDASGVSPHDVDWSATPGDATHQTVFVVGPEGGFSAEERDAFIDARATVVRLGNNVLRTSTAGPVALGIAATLSGRWT